MINTILTIATTIILISLVLSGYRFFKGPDTANRTVSFDVMTISSIGLIALIAHFAGRIIYLDIAIVYGLLSFLAVIIIAKYLEKELF
ncbi:MAG: monovalent cation/H+ antiporter complex subunit F [Bacteroidales bacterium]